MGSSAYKGSMFNSSRRRRQLRFIFNEVLPSNRILPGRIPCPVLVLQSCTLNIIIILFTKFLPQCSPLDLETLFLFSFAFLAYLYFAPSISIQLAIKISTAKEIDIFYLSTYLVLITNTAM